MGLGARAMADTARTRASRFDGAATVRHRTRMDTISYTAARENLAATMDRVCMDHSPVIITRNRDQAVVMLSLDDYQSLEETACLLRSPANALRLIEAVQALESSKGVVHEVNLDA